MNSDVKDALLSGGRVIVRQRKLRTGFSLDTELCSRLIGLMEIARAERAGEIRVKDIVSIPKGVMIEYELVPSTPPSEERKES